MFNINQRSIKKIITILFIATQSMLSAQVDGLRVDLRIDENTIIHPEADVHKDKIIRNLQLHLGKYNDAAFLIDVDEGTVTAKSIESFTSLFHSNARVFNDVIKYGTQIPIDDYVGIVAERMTKKGVEFKITDMLLKRVDNNPAFPGELIFEAKVMVNKLMLSRLDEKSGKQVEIPDGGDVVSQEFTILIQGADLSDIQIYGINSKSIPRPKPFQSELRVATSYGINANSSFVVHKNFISSFSPDIKAASMIDANFAYARGFKRGGQSKWLIGVGHGQHKWELNTSSGNSENKIYRTSTSNSSNNTLLFNTSYAYDNVVNQLSFSYFQGLIGVQLPLKKILGYKLEYWIEGVILPTYISKKESLAVTQIQELSVVTLRDIDETYCDDLYQLEDRSFEEVSNVMSIGLQLKPYLRYYLNDANTTGLTVGAGYTYYLQSWLNPNTASIHSVDSSSPKSIMLNQLTPAHLRFELGLTFKLNK